MTAPIHHHIDDDILLDYVTGAASEPVALVVACHLTLCAVCRALVATAESVGGTVLEHAPVVPLSEGALERLLGRLDDASPEVETAAADGDIDAPFMFEGVPLPRPLTRYLAPEQTAIPGPSRSGSARRRAGWRFMAPGIRGVDLQTSASLGVRTRLLRLAPQLEIPRHAHAAPEFTLVLSGGLAEGSEHYGPGDVRFCERDAVHVQRSDAGAPCIALVVNEGPLVPQTWRGHLASLLFDR